MTQIKTSILHCIFLFIHCHMSSSRVPCDIRPWSIDCRSQVMHGGNVTTLPLEQRKYILEDLGDQGVEDLSTVRTLVQLSGMNS